MLHLPRQLRRAMLGGWLTLALIAAALVVPLSVATPAHADTEDTANCIGALDCLYFRSGFSPTGDDEEDREPATQSYDVVPIDVPPPGDGDGADEARARAEALGTFRIRLHRSRHGGGTPQCLEGSDDDGADFHDCKVDADNNDDPEQRWYAEPVGVDENHEVVTDSTSPDAWNPWWDDQTDWNADRDLETKFYLRLASDGAAKDWCYGNKYQLRDNDNGVLMPCADISDEDLPDFQWNLYGGGKEPDYRMHAPDERDTLTAFLLGSGLEHSAARCGVQDWADLCSARLYDEQKRANITRWNRINQLVINEEPVPVTRPLGCAVTDPEAPGSAQTIYNAGDAPMTTTLGASGTSTYSHSFSQSLAVEASVKAGIEGLFEASFTITSTTSWGKVWTESSTVSQSVSWTVPPHRYATASLSTTALDLTAAWRFRTKDGFNPWNTDRFTHLTVPYATGADATAPKTVLAVYNSLGPKDCGAAPPSRLDPSRILRVSNTSADGSAPVVGDVLSAEDLEDVDPAWWQKPDTDQTPVNLHYQWYRQRGDAPPEPIQNANLATYTVTTDDVTDEEILDRVGPYHLLVGVTDVANANRFDSREYHSVATAATSAPEDGVRSTKLAVAVANPDADAGTDTRIQVDASVRGGATPTGTIALLDNGEVILSEVALDANGKAEISVRLARGLHRLEARYDGDGTATPAQSEVVETTIAGAASTTALALGLTTAAVGEETDATVTVSPTRAGADVPTGTVQLFDGEHTVGDPVPLDVTGTAIVRLPGALTKTPRQITARYRGDDVYDPSTSLPVTQHVVAAPTTIDVALNRKVTHRRGGARFRVTVEHPTGSTPTGMVQFLVDGRSRGPKVRLNRAGRAVLRTHGFEVGKRRISARFLPEHTDQARATSRARRLDVRRHGVRIRVRADERRVARRDTVLLTGRVRTRDGRGRVGTPKVRILLDGRRVGRDRLGRDGTFRFRLPARRLSRGVHTLRVVYPGNQVRSVAPGKSPGLKVRRR